MRPEAAELEDRIAGIAAEVSGRRRIRPNDPLELDSLGRAELAVALEEAFGVRLDDIARMGTVRQAAEAVVGLLGARGPEGPLLPRDIGRIQQTAKVLGGGAFSWYLRLRVTGAGRVPRRGPVVLCSNHESWLDIPLVVIATPRPVWFMAKQELFARKLGGRLLELLGGFPVRREASDVRAVRAALAVLRGGRVLGMYPEGTRSAEFLPFLPGAAWMALTIGAPLVPLGIVGTGESVPPSGVHWPRRGQVRMSFGQPIEVDREDDARARLEKAGKLTEQLRVDIERLIRG